MFYVKGLQQQHGIRDANLKAMLEPHCSRMLSRVFGASCNFYAHGTQNPGGGGSHGTCFI